ncbi:phage portal protein [Sporosarcina sp. A2]|uniref:phage portal protein n=1 Tax=Sporosarcina sp. A2 TaxID=3393449 RepID=UPI003D7BBFF3
MGLFDRLLGKLGPDSEIGWSFDLELFEKTSERTYMKRLAVEICISFLARTISQSEFRVKNGEKYLKDELYYKLNVRPSKNTTASTFWQTVIHKLVYDNEVLIITSDDDDLLIADDFQHNEFAVYDDIFSNVVVKGFEFKRTFNQQEVIHLRYGNEKLQTLINSLFADYGELFGRVLAAQKRKNQIRSTVDMDMLAAKGTEHQAKFQQFIDNMYAAIEKKDVAIIPQQKGITYDEKTAGSLPGQTVDDLDRVTDGFLNQVAMAMGIPVSLLRGDMADVEKQTKNYMFFTVSPLLKKIKDEANVKFFTMSEYLKGDCIDIRKPSYRDIFDLATAVDKLRASGIMNGHEIRSELGLERVENEMLDSYVITKNYQDGDDLKGGENE